MIWRRFMNWLRFGDARLERESSQVIALARTLRARVEEYQKHPDPFRAMTVTMATNAYEGAQERNIWRGSHDRKG
jgi:hypothetical protein